MICAAGSCVCSKHLTTYVTISSLTVEKIKSGVCCSIQFQMMFSSCVNGSCNDVMLYGVLVWGCALALSSLVASSSELKLSILIASRVWMSVAVSGCGWCEDAAVGFRLCCGWNTLMGECLLDQMPVWSSVLDGLRPMLVEEDLGGTLGDLRDCVLRNGSLVGAPIGHKAGRGVD